MIAFAMAAAMTAFTAAVSNTQANYHQQAERTTALSAMRHDEYSTNATSREKNISLKQQIRAAGTADAGPV